MMEKLVKGKTIEERLNEIEGLVAVDLDSAKEILQSVIRDNKNDFYAIEINCVANMIREEELYLELTSRQKMNYDGLRVLGKDFYEDGDFERAYYHYELAKEETNHPIFDYYLGKMLYKQKKYIEALPYLQEYSSYGGKKLTRCLFYMMLIYNKQGQHKKVNKLLSKFERLESTFKFNFSLERYRFQRCHKKNGNSFYDYVKDIAISETKMDLGDFSEEVDELDISSYDSYNFHQKLLIIKKLMIQSQQKIADSYLNDLIPETKEEHKELAQFQKNKKIYRNQGK